MFSLSLSPMNFYYIFKIKTHVWHYLISGLLRCGKSCRLRWMNYLRPDIKRGNITPEEDDLIIRMHSLLGNRWSLIAGRLPGRTDNEIKNYWNTHLSKRLKAQLGPHYHEAATAKKRNNSNDNNNKKKKKKTVKKNKTKSSSNNVEVMQQEEEEEKKKKTNVYLPKPIRVRALPVERNSSTTTLTGDSNNGSSSSSQDKEESPELLQNSKEVNIWGEINYDEFGFFGEEGNNNYNVDLVNGGYVSEENNYMECESSLEKLYEEYFQLLKSNNCEENQGELDSFAQSLFV